MFGEMLGKAVVGDSSCLFQAWHSFLDFHVNPAVVGCERLEVVFVDDFVGHFGDMDFHVFVAGHGGTVIEIFQIECTESGVGR